MHEAIMDVRRGVGHLDRSDETNGILFSLEALFKTPEFSSAEFGSFT